MLQFAQHAVIEALGDFFGIWSRRCSILLHMPSMVVTSIRYRNEVDRGQFDIGWHIACSPICP